MNYNFLEIEQKWKKKWEEDDYFANLNYGNKYYVLEMFPYPSGNLHMGHVFNYTIGDVIARYKRMQGFDVIRPMGWDAFGLPAENAAIENKVHPADWTYQNIAKMRSQFEKLGLMIDWSREVTTCDSEYYKHEQKMFIDFYNKGLAYQKESIVNWDPIDNTVLANEQVVDGRGWRSGAIVEKKNLKQWFLKITNYAEELLSELENLKGWPEKIKLMQKNWIGKSEGVEIEFELVEFSGKIKVFTTRPDTIFGTNGIAISADHPIAIELAKKNKEIVNFIEECKKGEVTEEALQTKEKLGINTGLFCRNPINEEKIPVWIANFVLMDYGTGAIMMVPSHDERDFEFAVKYGLNVRQVIISEREAIFESERFIYRAIKDDDIDNFFALYGDNDVMKYAVVGTKTIEETRELIKEYKENFKRDGFGFYAIVKKGTGEFVGRCGFQNFFKEFGYMSQNCFILKKFWGKGYGSEIAKATANYGFSILNQEKVSIAIHPENKASFVLFEKLGIEKANEIEVLGQRLIVHDLRKDNFYQKTQYKGFCNSEYGYGVNSRFLNGLKTEEAKSRIISELERIGSGYRKITYRLKDWGVSRQRYWGCPIPMVYCEKCGTVPERIESLPVELPKDVDFSGKGNPLANHPNWKRCRCPKCGGDGERETDTFDTFFESSWYFARFCDPKNKEIGFGKEIGNKLLPVDQYIGGAEHAVMHLLYARFFTKALRECGYLSINEPFTNLINQGMILHATYKDSNGKYVFPSEVYKENGRYYHEKTKEEIKVDPAIKMSKSKKNVVDPTEMIETYGADAIRLFMLSDSPIDRGFEWSANGVDAAYRYVNKIWKTGNLIADLEKDTEQNEENRKKLRKKLHRTIMEINSEIKAFGFNKAIAKIRELHNAMDEIGYTNENRVVIIETFSAMTSILSIFIPHISNEISELLGIDIGKFPEHNSEIAKEETINLAVQVNGKLRGVIEVKFNETEGRCIEIAKKNENIKKYIKGNEIKKVIFIQNKILNIISVA